MPYQSQNDDKHPYFCTTHYSCTPSVSVFLFLALLANSRLISLNLASDFRSIVLLLDEGIVDSYKPLRPLICTSF